MTPAVSTANVPAAPSGERAGLPGGDYAELRRLIRQEGLLKRRPLYYSVKIAIVVVLLAGGWTAFALVGDSWWQMLVAVYLALVFGQIGFVGHEAGHHQIFHTRRGNGAVGLVGGNLLIGMSFGWWTGKHSRHHAFPNHEGRDPDIAIPVIAFTREQASKRRGLFRALARAQAYLFFPMLLLEALSMHVISVWAILRGPVRRRARWLECLLLMTHCAGYLTAVLLVLSPLRAVVFIAIQQGLFGLYLGCAFAPNHKGMPTPTGRDATSFLRRQVVSSRNVRPGWFVDWALGGLNYQIEHHLFPSMPRVNLKHARPMVRDYCAGIDLPYLECGLSSSYRQALEHLDAMGVVGSTPLEAAG